MAQFNITTTGTVGTVIIDDLHLTLTHPQTIDLRNDIVEKFSWAEILESDDLQTAIDAGEIVATDDAANTIPAVTLDHLSFAISQAVSGTVQDAIVDGVTTVAPSQNAVFDALALKLDAAGVTAFAATLLDDADAVTMRTTLGLGTAATAATGDFATAAQGTTADSAVQPGDNISGLVNDSGFVNAATAALAAPIQSVFGRTTSAIVAVASDYDDSQIDLTYTPINFTATNSFVDGAIQGLDNALAAITGDGNDTPIVRGNSTTGVQPTVGEVASPESGDTASIFLSDGTLEKWVHNGTVWSLAYTLAAGGGADLAYTASPTNGIVTSSTGTNATISLATGTNAGLLAPAAFDKLGFISITQAVNLDTIESTQNSLVTLSGVSTGSLTLGIFSGNTITDNVSTKVAIQELETAIEANVYGTEFNLFQSTGVSTTTSTTFQSKITGNTTTLSTGDYKILVSYSWNHNATQNDFESRFLFDGVAVGQNSSGLIHKAEPKDAAGNFSGTGSAQQFTFTQAYYVTGVTAGIKTIALDYRTDKNGVASSIWDCSIEIIRIQ